MSGFDPNALNKAIPRKVGGIGENNNPNPLGKSDKKSKYSWVIGIIIIIAFGVWGYLGDNENTTT